MILSKPLPGQNHVSVTMIIRLGAIGEVPQAAYCSNQELRASDNESTDPEQSEKVIDPHISSRCVPLDVSDYTA